MGLSIEAGLAIWLIGILLVGTIFWKVITILLSGFIILFSLKIAGSGIGWYLTSGNENYEAFFGGHTYFFALHILAFLSIVLISFLIHRYIPLKVRISLLTFFFVIILGLRVIYGEGE